MNLHSLNMTTLDEALAYWRAHHPRFVFEGGNFLWGGLHYPARYRSAGTEHPDEWMHLTHADVETTARRFRQQ